MEWIIFQNKEVRYNVGGRKRCPSKSSKLHSEEKWGSFWEVFVHYARHWCWAESTACRMWWNSVKWGSKQRRLNTKHLWYVGRPIEYLLKKRDKPQATHEHIFSLKTQSKAILKIVISILMLLSAQKPFTMSKNRWHSSTSSFIHERISVNPDC